MAKAIKVKETSFDVACRTLLNANIAHTWVNRLIAKQYRVIIVLNKNKENAIKALEDAKVRIYKISNKRHWEAICLTNGWFEPEKGAA